MTSRHRAQRCGWRRRAALQVGATYDLINPGRKKFKAPIYPGSRMRLGDGRPPVDVAIF
jgi:hypothetical protein